EVREPEITKYLLALATRAELPVVVRARAIGAIEADQPWEREALAALAHDATTDESIRAAAIQAMGAFATTRELVERVGPLAAATSPAIRGALLWALQLARRSDGDAPAIAKLVEPMLGDADPNVRRRAGYAAGNLGLAQLAPALAKLCAAAEPSELRLAGYVALGELGVPAGVVAELVGHIRREDEPRVLGAASNALIASTADANALAPLAGRARELLGAPDAQLREAGAELA